MSRAWKIHQVPTNFVILPNHRTNLNSVQPRGIRVEMPDASLLKIFWALRGVVFMRMLVGIDYRYRRDD